MRRVKRLHRLLSLILCAAFAAAPVRAQDRRYAYEVELAATAKQATVRAGGVDWLCSGTHCTAEARGGAVSVRSCSELARAVGPIRRYASELRQLGENELAECNQAATATVPTAAPKPAAVAAAPAASKGPAPKAVAGRTPELTYTGVWPGGRESGAK
jgi:hypothetical protein